MNRCIRRRYELGSFLAGLVIDQTRRLVWENKPGSGFRGARIVAPLWAGVPIEEQILEHHRITEKLGQPTVEGHPV